MICHKQISVEIDVVESQKNQKYELNVINV